MTTPTIGTGWTIVDMIDTRHFDFQTGKPIPGSGDGRPCDCCGKTILIHVVVSRVGERRIIGRDCAAGAGAAVKGKARLASAARCPARVEALRAQRAEKAARHAVAVAAKVAAGFAPAWAEIEVAADEALAAC